MSTTFESTRNSSAHHHGSATTTTTSQSLNKLNQTSTVHSSTLLLLLKNQYINTKERQQWESYFDPQYTFESRTAEKHSSKKPDPSYLYTPQETQQTLQTLPGQKVPGTSVHLFDSSSYQSNTSMFSYVSSPILPDIDKLKVHGTAHTSAHAQSTTDQIEIVPSPSTFIKPRDRRQNTLDEKKQIHRIELLNSIRQEGLLDENDTVRHPKGMSKTEKWQRRFKERAEEWKHQVVSMDDSLKGKGPKLTLFYIPLYSGMA
ncbi:hypothetical protein BDF14DRAFT_1740251 [Spinellus fusiger]|nr:hypothetical protein BDF14DRAFT_1740251 [Spinellus fusiger]